MALVIGCGSSSGGNGSDAPGASAELASEV